MILTMHGEEEIDRPGPAGRGVGLPAEGLLDGPGGGHAAGRRRRRHRPVGRPRPVDAGRAARPRATADARLVLSQREAEVLQLFADGCSTVEVGQRLYISAKTVKNHLASIYEKLDARDRTQAVLTAVRMGIIRLN